MGRKSHNSEKNQKGLLSKETKGQIQFMKEQYELGDQQNAAAVEAAMENSFCERYDYILYKGPKVTQLQSLFPFLFEKKHFFAEFSRIAKVDTWGNYMSNLKKYVDVILHVVSRLNPTKALLQKALDKNPSEDRKQYIKCVAALILLPILVGENITAIAKFECKESTSVYPEIVCESAMDTIMFEEQTFSIYVEEGKVFETTSFVEAVYLGIAAHYCFDIQYPDGFASSAALIEKLLFGMQPDGGTLTTEVKEQYTFLTLYYEHKFAKKS